MGHGMHWAYASAVKLGLNSKAAAHPVTLPLFWFWLKLYAGGLHDGIGWAGLAGGGSGGACTQVARCAHLLALGRLVVRGRLFAEVGCGCS